MCFPVTKLSINIPYYSCSDIHIRDATHSLPKLCHEISEIFAITVSGIAIRSIKGINGREKNEVGVWGKLRGANGEADLAIRI